MKLLNLTPFVAAGVCVLLVEVLNGTVSVWMGWTIVVVAVASYGWIATAIVKWFFRDDRDAEIAAQMAIIDANKYQPSRKAAE